ncbi:7-carboxy-7-deazaguanine synthase QueE [Oscillatoria sp. FACHB-1406]|uniref:7-carboxy-7-deazaguanine synthase QueE n=1 Tax=Oscillatoria sp. FACHB-1406 TaxID=2692846 RepID=UPI001683B032|nr:7-carboxy-7-deazaguanine synthase QueE [Oscillatoria sp. FACHB-1406]MBD2578564.1 7-carboxy-7-deazaguanine synthase QueE [Oscillatoria sp. FACHB-1406]
MNSSLPIHETFQQTLQGEGYWAGTPVDFIRLAGCPVRCPWCDTGYAEGGIGLPRRMMTFEELLGELKSPRVVISGGEPFLHSQLPGLIEVLEAAGKMVAIETSGAFWQEISARTWVTLSPKQHVSPRYPVHPQMWKRANEIKLVVETGLELEFYAPYLPPETMIPVFLQPEWTQRDRALPIILDLLQQFPQYRLSVQLHKYLQIP